MATKLMNSVRSSIVEETVGKTILGEYISSIDGYLLDTYCNPSSDGSNYAIPDVISCCNMFPGLRERFIKLYNGVLGNTSGVENIPDKIKVIQGALFDGLVFGYDASSGKVELYTANMNLSTDITNVGRDFSDEKFCKDVMKNNLVGKFKSLRVDVEYNNGSDEFSYKFVNHRKALLLGSTYFIPYLPILRSMKFIEDMMNTGKAVMVVQQVPQGGHKARVITENRELLGKYCDDPNCVGGLKCDYYPLKSFMYAPCLGAPSTTAMCTNVDLFNLDRLQVVSGSDIDKLGIEKPVNPLRSVFSNCEIDRCLMDIFEEDRDKYWEIITTLPRSSEFFGGNTYDGDKMVPRGAMSNYLHSLKSDELNQVESMIPGVKDGISRKSAIIRSFTEVDPSISVEEMSNLLKKHVCRVLIRKKDCTFSSLTVTNNVEYLKMFYGNDYMKYYESFNVRFSVLCSKIVQGYRVEDTFIDMGFEDYYYEMRREKSLDSITPESLTEKYRDELRHSLSIYYSESRYPGYNKLGEDTILARSLFAVLANNGSPMGYYRNVTMSNIVKLFVMS